MEAWYLVTTKIKSEQRVQNNLLARHELETFVPRYPKSKTSSATGLPLFARYVFVRCDPERDFGKIQYTPGVSKIVMFGERATPVPEDVIACLYARCDENQEVKPPALDAGQKVRVKQGFFDGCEGIIREKHGNKRIQLLLKLVSSEWKVELDASEVELTGN